MGIRDVLARDDVGFMSLHKLLDSMAAVEGATFREAATALLRLLREQPDGDTPSWHFCCPLNGAVSDHEDGQSLGRSALSWASQNGAPPAPASSWMLDDGTRTAFDQCGFMTNDIATFLAKHGIRIKDAEPGADEPPAGSLPEWKAVLSLLPTLTLREAAMAFANKGPDACSVVVWDQIVDHHEVEKWISVLFEAVKLGELRPSPIKQNCHYSELHLNAADLVAWCQLVGHRYPLRPRPLLQVTTPQQRSPHQEAKTEALTRAEPAIDVTETTVMPPSSSAAEPGTSGTQHHMPRGRTNNLKSVIEKARESATNRDDWASVWLALVEMARADDRPSPLLGFSDDEGVKWEATDDRTEPVRWLTRDALRKRLTPRR